jgi:hypothetical protein
MITFIIDSKIGRTAQILEYNKTNKQSNLIRIILNLILDTIE